MLEKRRRLIVLRARILLASLPYLLRRGFETLVLGYFLRKQDLIIGGRQRHTIWGIVGIWIKISLSMSKELFRTTK
jgi:hypothetical protein